MSNDKYKEITEIIEKEYVGEIKKPKIRIMPGFLGISKEMIVIDVPKKTRFMHGSSHYVECNKDCRIEGLIVADTNKEKEIDNNIKNLKCDIRYIHRYAYTENSNIRFVCKNKKFEETKNIINYLKVF